MLITHKIDRSFPYIEKKKKEKRSFHRNAAEEISFDMIVKRKNAHSSARERVTHKFIFSRFFFGSQSSAALNATIRLHASEKKKNGERVRRNATSTCLAAR